MNDIRISEQFKQFAAEQGSVIDGALLVALTIDADIDISTIRADVRHLAGRFAEQHEGEISGEALIGFLRADGFRGAESYYTPDNSSLAYVLRERRGIPISLAAVVLGIAEIVGIPARGVNFPQHFLVDVDGKLADPFRMQMISPAQQQAWLQAQGVSFAEAFPTASPQDVVVRMLNNLRMLASERADHSAVLDYLGYQLLLVNEPLPYHLMRVDAWMALGAPEMACHEIDICLPLVDDAALKEQLLKRRASLQDTPHRLH